MANSTSDILTKRNAKLESFLKLNLNQHAFERIRAYEACIVNFRKEKRAFKYVILSDERIYLTENPPKSIREEDAVHLEDVVSINLVNEFPDFLNGEERENAQHIQVVYKKPLKKAADKKPDGQADSRDEDVSAAGVNGDQDTDVPGLLVTEPNGHTRRSSQQFERGGRSSLLQKQMPTLHRSFDESELKMLREMQSVDSPDSDDDRLSMSYPSSNWSELSRTSSISSMESFDSSVSSEQSRRKLVAVETIRPLPQRPQGDGQLASKMSGMTLISKEDVSQTLASPPSTYRSLPSPDNINDKRSKQPFKFPSSLQEEDNNNLPLLRRSLSSDSYHNEEGTGRKSKLPGVVKKKKKAFLEMHLFILSQSSPFLMHLRSSWNNLTIRSTYLLDNDVAERLKVSSTSTSSKQLEHQFSQLKKEILNSGRSMEALFSLIQELTNAAEKYFVLKRLFWKSDELLLFILHTLQLYLPKSGADLLTEGGRHERADELELAILLIETIGLMLHDTEIISNRLALLKSNRGKIMSDLVAILTCLPEIPQRWRPPRLKAQSLIQTDADGWESSGDAERRQRGSIAAEEESSKDSKSIFFPQVSKLVQELTNASTAVLYELILVTQQATWAGEEGQFLNLGGLVQFLNSRKAVTFNFIERLLTQAMKLLLPSKDLTLSPDQAVLLFQQFYVLHALLQHSSMISVHIRSSYYEEFRYYVQSPHIVNKLPAHFPITRNTFQLIEEVLKHVLQSKVSIN